MSAWLKKKGVKSQRIIVENRSMSTTQNAVYSYDIIKKKYPNIKKIVIVTSDYHVPASALLFEARCLIMAKKDGLKEPVQVVANYGNYTGWRYFSLATQANWLWALESY